MAKITFSDKQTLIDLPDIAEVNKMTAPNVNEIKTSVNDAYDIIDILKHNKTNLPEGINADCLMMNDTTTQGVNLDYNPLNAPEANKMVMWWAYKTINTGADAYWTYIVLAITLDDHKLWLNAYHNSVSSWIGWQQL